MTEQELRELEQLAKAAMKQNPGESQDILEQALQERKQKMWDAIQKKARRRVRMRKARPWIAAAAVVMMAVVISGAIGVNQARAGKEGLLVDIVEGVAGDIDIAFSEQPTDFVPAIIENGTWDEITGAIEDESLMELLPKDMPARYKFFSGTYNAPDKNVAELWLVYYHTVDDGNVLIEYNYSSKSAVDISKAIQTENSTHINIENWNGMKVYLIETDGQPTLMWDQEGWVISITGDVNQDDLREIFESIIK
jgi:hypothetical protein